MEILDLFEQRLELVKEYPSWIEYTCPLCGSPGLKINKTTSYYKNYKCTCDTKRISAFIYQDSGVIYIPKPKQLPKLVESVPNLSNLKLSILTKNTSITDLNTKYQDLDGVVLYKYSTTQRTKRINRLKSNGKKIVIPQTLKDSSWINGIGDTSFPLFTNQQTLIGELILVVEGEKCVEYLNSKGIEAISLLGSYSTSITKIQEALELSRSLVPNVRQFLYLPDLDTTGVQKADIFQRAVWEMKLSCKIFDLRGKLLEPKKYSFNFKRGYDIADYIMEFSDSNLVSVVEDEFRNRSTY